MSRIHLDASRSHAAPLVPPPSKSDAHRALLAEYLGAAWSSPALSGCGRELPRDVEILSRGLRALTSPEPVAIDCEDAGAPFRFLLTQACVAPERRVRFSGSARLGERPHGPLLRALEATLGPAGLVLSPGDPWPLVVRSPPSVAVENCVFRVSGLSSSQYASSLLFGCVALSLRDRRVWAVELDGPVTSPGYLDMTLDWLSAAGFAVQREHSRLCVGFTRRPARSRVVPGDWSAISYLLLISWRTRGFVENVEMDSAHPDRVVLDHLRSVGLDTCVTGEGLTVRGTASTGLNASGRESPDLLPTLAALACVLPQRSRLEHVGVLRNKESDRLQGIRDLVTAFGGHTTLLGDTLDIVPPASRSERLVVDSHGDHRLAMAAAALSVISRVPLELTRAACVNKSFPGFWQQLQHSGVRLHVVGSARHAAAALRDGENVTRSHQDS